MGQVCIRETVCGDVFCGHRRRISRNRRPVSRFVASPHRLQLRRQLSPVSLAKGPSTQISSAQAFATGRSLLPRTKDNLTKWAHIGASALERVSRRHLDGSVPECAEGIIWRSISDKNEVLKVKEQLRNEKQDSAFSSMKCKEELIKVLTYIDSLKYFDHVDYEFIYKMLTQAAKTEGGDINDPYDWERSSATSTAGTTAKSKSLLASH
ncbi:hypothetical protein RB195_012198 [Necator americanus]|uniref:Uncharacterized protein n=1 Tax=Necator americanus TaxID=51031 RepID=A0ABR1D650_NECAM